MDDSILAVLEEALPEFFLRADVTTLTNGLCKTTTLAKLNGQGEGPTPHRTGKKVVYLKKEFLAWFKTHMEQVEERYNLSEASGGERLAGMNRSK